MGTREQPTSQLRWKRKRKRRRKRRRNKYFLTFLLRPSDSPSNHLLHLKSSITSTQHPPHGQSSKKNKRSVFMESFRETYDLVSNRLETLANKQATLYIDSLTSIASKNVFHKISALPQKILFFLDFFTHTLLSLYNCDFRDDTRYNF